MVSGTLGLTREFARMYERTSRNIFEYAKEMGFRASDQQLDLLLAVQNGDRRIAVSSGQGTGKTAVSTLIVSWRTWRRRKALSIVQAPTMRQCKDVWLRTFRELLSRASPLMRQCWTLTSTYAYVLGDKDWAIRLVTAARVENAQGIHNDHLTFGLDEASGISSEHIEQIEGTLSQNSGDSLFLAIANPNTRECEFFRFFHEDSHQWRTFVWNAEESPFCDPETHKHLADTWGRDSDTYRVRVLGLFPRQDPNCLLTVDQVMKCFDTDPLTTMQIKRLHRSKDKPAKQIGIDFSRNGGDESVIYARSGQAVVAHRTFTYTEPSDVILAAFQIQDDWKWRDEEAVYVADCQGIGDGVASMFYKHNKKLLEFRGQSSSSSRQYENAATEAWFELRDKIRHLEVTLPRDQILMHQLTTRHFDTVERNSKYMLEPKKSYRKRGYKSPDRADALAMCFYDGGVARGHGASSLQQTRKPTMKVFL